MAFHRFCKAIIQHQPLGIYDNGEQTRDFTYISDVIEANIRAAASDGSIAQVLNIAGGSRVTIRQVIQLLQEITGISTSLKFEEKQNGDVRNTFADISLAERVIEYHPVVSLHEGLRQEFEYIRSLYEC